MNALATYKTRLQSHWQGLARREQTLVLAAGSVVALALLWWLAVAPALQTLRTAPARHAEIDSQLQRMQALQAEALQLKDAPRARSGDAVRALQASVAQHLGTAAQMSTAGDRATVTLKSAPADRVAEWLSQARGTAHAVPVEARLVRAAASGAAPATAPAGIPRWDGTLVLALPPN